MSSWNQIHEEIIGDIILRQRSSSYDDVRRKYLKKLSEYTNRNVVAYYSGWLQRSGPDVAYLVSINDDDKNGFMACFHGLDFSKGLDLILHSPGGDVAATESIIDYLRSKFGHDIRIIVPQISMSGGTMIACAGKEIVMGRHSNLGPIDPQFGSWPAIAIIKEFERAKQEVAADHRNALVWQPILSHYGPTLLSKAQQAIDWSKEIGVNALRDGMFRDDPDAAAKASDIVEFLISHEVHKAHGRHLHRKELRDKGLKIQDLEGNQEFQNAVLCVHHAFTNTLMNTNAIKIIENHAGMAMVRTVFDNQQPRRAQPERRATASEKQDIKLVDRVKLAVKVLLNI
jgi:hypothetical protein